MKRVSALGNCRKTSQNIKTERENDGNCLIEIYEICTKHSLDVNLISFRPADSDSNWKKMRRSFFQQTTNWKPRVRVANEVGNCQLHRHPILFAYFTLACSSTARSLGKRMCMGEATARHKTTRVRDQSRMRNDVETLFFISYTFSIHKFQFNSMRNVIPISNSFALARSLHPVSARRRLCLAREYLYEFCLAE